MLAHAERRSVDSISLVDDGSVWNHAGEKELYEAIVHVLGEKCRDIMPQVDVGRAYECCRRS